MKLLKNKSCLISKTKFCFLTLPTKNNQKVTLFLHSPVSINMKNSQEYIERRFRSGETLKKGITGKIQRLKEKRLATKFANKSHKLIKKTMSGVEQEAVETKEMAQSFFKLLESKLNLKDRTEPPTEEEVKAAIEQLKDVGRFTFFSAVSILPGGGAGLIGLEILARKLGVKNFTFVPSAFRKEEKNSQKDESETQ